MLQEAIALQDTTMQRLAFIVLFLSTASMTAHASPGGDFKALLDEHWATANREQVFFRTDPDAWRMHGKLAEFTAEARARRQKYNDAVLDRLASIDVTDLPAAQQLSFRLFRYERLAEQESYRQPEHLLPITSMFGYHSYFADAPANMSFLTARDYEDYLVSLGDFPRYNREHLDLMREAVARGYTQQCDAMQGVRKGIQGLIVDDPAASTLHGPFERFPSSIPAGQQADISERGTVLIALKVIPAFRELLQFYDAHYMPYCRKDAGIGGVEGGSDFYSWRVRYFTTTDMTPAEIHELGKSELARIRREMDSIIDASGFDGDFAAFLQFLRTDPRFYAEDVPELLGRAALIAKTAEGELPRFFTVLPRGTYNIKANPGRGSYYVGSSGDGTTSGTYFVGTANLDAEPLFTLEALTLHEGVPGHHLQSAIAMELDVPEFRRTVYHSAFGEGWGLYSEGLGTEMGFYRDPYNDFGRLTYEAWRACRLVVDTGMHAFGWTRQQAIDFMLQNTALSEFEIRNEVDRYITWPAQALAYKIGEIRIRAMREKAERVLGADFDLRRFHDIVIGNGSLPIDILDALVDTWIENELRNAGG
jgi:uncharacterized protein (DUF885 family)